MDNFKGDLNWIHKWEGHVGKPYWPKGRSGVTLDPGVDLGYADWSLVERAYGPLVPEDQMEDLRRAEGIRGDDAGKFLEQARAQNAPFTKIRISREQAGDLFSIVAEPYWQRISKRFPALLEGAVPAAVHTAFLSLAYNRGPGNRDFEQLREPLGSGDWRQVGTRIAGMQQDHKLKGIRRRRCEEGNLVLLKSSDVIRERAGALLREVLHLLEIQDVDRLKPSVSGELGALLYFLGQS